MQTARLANWHAATVSCRQASLANFTMSRQLRMHLTANASLLVRLSWTNAEKWPQQSYHTLAECSFIWQAGSMSQSAMRVQEPTACSA